MTSFGYTGPATLIIGGNELHIAARLGVESEAVNGFITRRWWADLTFHPFTPPNEDVPCRLRLPDGREGSGHLPAGETRMQGAGFPPTALPLPDADVDDIEVHAVDEHGYRTVRIIPSTPPTAELVALRAEVARLRAGESPNPAPEGVQHTPAQWIHRWNQATADERLAKVEQIFHDSGTATRCRYQDHDAVLHELANALQSINRVREFADQIAKGSRTVSREFIAQALIRLLDGEPT